MGGPKVHTHLDQHVRKVEPIFWEATLEPRFEFSDYIRTISNLDELGFEVGFLHSSQVTGCGKGGGAALRYGA